MQQCERKPEVGSRGPNSQVPTMCQKWCFIRVARENGHAQMAKSEECLFHGPVPANEKRASSAAETRAGPNHPESMPQFRCGKGATIGVHPHYARALPTTDGEADEATLRAKRIGKKRAQTQHTHGNRKLRTWGKPGTRTNSMLTVLCMDVSVTGSPTTLEIR